MPRVHFVKKAAKDHDNIKKGESYYWWKFNYGPLVRSKTAPKASQLTMSEYQGRVLDIQERLASVAKGSPEDIQSEVESIKEEIETLRDEQEEKLDNLPDNFKEVGTGELLQERYDALDQAISEIDGIGFDREEDEDDDDYANRIEEEINNVSFS